MIGQAIAIHEWEFEDGTRGGPIAEENAVDKRVEAASAEGGNVQQAGESHALFVLRCQNQDSTATLLALVADVIPSTFLWCVP